MFTLLFTVEKVLPYPFLEFKDLDKYCDGHGTVTISLKSSVATHTLLLYNYIIQCFVFKYKCCMHVYTVYKQ